MDRAPLAFAKHDHERCRADALADAQHLCKTRGVRLTPVRERVLDLLWQAHRPLRAYDILETLSAEGFGSQPPVVYRALDFLIEQGFAHKIERLNAYLACDCPTDDHGAKFLICTACERVAEFDDRAIAEALSEVAAGSGFMIGRATLEVEGLCPDCCDAEGGANG
ncbi:MAG: Fur family transcriptional regulator [Alphaproteobacteria bacterium]